MLKKTKRNLIIGALILVNTCGYFAIQYNKQVNDEKARLEVERIDRAIEEKIKADAEKARLKEIEDEKARIKAEEDRIEAERVALEEKERNRINSIKYDSNNLLVVSNITVDEMTKLLSVTHNGAAHNLVPLANAFVDAEAKYGVNALFLVGLVAEESYWGRSDRAVNTNNMTGMAVYNDSSKGTHYTTKYASVMDAARQIKNNYLTESGPYYNGVSIYGVNTLYCQGPNATNWSRNINSITNKLVSEYRELF